MTRGDMDLYAPVDDCGAGCAERTCGTCAHLIEGPCDYGACDLEVWRHFEGARADASEAVEWALAHLHDAQADDCEDWEAC